MVQVLRQQVRQFMHNNAFISGILLVGTGAVLISFSSVFVAVSHTGPTADVLAGSKDDCRQCICEGRTGHRRDRGGVGDRSRSDGATLA